MILILTHLLLCNFSKSQFNETFPVDFFYDSNSFGLKIRDILMKRGTALKIFHVKQNYWLSIRISPRNRNHISKILEHVNQEPRWVNFAKQLRGGVNISWPCPFQWKPTFSMILCIWLSFKTISIIRYAIYMTVNRMHARIKKNMEIILFLTI